jgi:hypothetical protein
MRGMMDSASGRHAVPNIKTIAGQMRSRYRVKGCAGRANSFGRHPLTEVDRDEVRLGPHLLVVFERRDFHVCVGGVGAVHRLAAMTMSQPEPTA